MIAHQWELRTDVRPLDQAAVRWSEVARDVGQRADDIVDAARRALDGWDAAAADSYEHHRRQVIAHLDQFTTLAGEMSNSLQALSGLLGSCQKELDSAWIKVAMVPHELIGADRALVFTSETDDDREVVRRGVEEVEAIRRRLAMALDQESDRSRRARSEFVLVRTALSELAGGTLDFGAGVGTLASGVGGTGTLSTSVSGSAQSGVSAIPVLGAITSAPVAMPHLSGLAATGLTPSLGAVAAGAAGRRSSTRTQGSTPPMAGGMAGGMGGGMGAGGGAGAMRGGSSGAAGGRRTGGGSGRVPPPKLTGTTGTTGAPGSGVSGAARGAGAAQNAATNATGKAATGTGRSAGMTAATGAGHSAGHSADKDALKEVKRAAIEAKRAERAARRSARERDGREKDRHDEDPRDPTTKETSEESTEPEGATEDGVEPRPAAIRIVESAPDGRLGSDRL